MDKHYLHSKISYSRHLKESQPYLQALFTKILSSNNNDLFDFMAYGFYQNSIQCQFYRVIIMLKFYRVITMLKNKVLILIKR